MKVSVKIYGGVRHGTIGYVVSCGEANFPFLCNVKLPAQVQRLDDLASVRPRRLGLQDIVYGQSVETHIIIWIVTAGVGKSVVDGERPRIAEVGTMGWHAKRILRKEILRLFLLLFFLFLSFV